MGSIAVADERHWHELRKHHVGSSEVSALFGLHPFGLTKWQLWHHKRGTLSAELDNTSVRQGQHFEPAVASYAQEKFGIKLRKVRRYLSCDDCSGLGASIDYEQFSTGVGLIPTELKWSVWGDGWEYTGDDLTQAPDAYLLQVQCQLACCTAPYGQLLAFTGGDLRRMIIPRSESLINAIRSQVFTFWKSIADNKEPPCDFAKDADSITDMAYGRPLRDVPLPAEAEALMILAKEQTAIKTAAEKAAKAAKAELIKMVMDIPGAMGNADKCVATAGGWKMSLTKVADNPGRPAEPGEIVGARSGYLLAKISTQKETE